MTNTEEDLAYCKSALDRETTRRLDRDAENAAYVKRVAELVDALERQLENMSFILNRVELHQWHGKFESEMLKDWELLKL
jgi:hypothetical protein